MLIFEIEENTIPPVPPEKARLDALKRQKQNITKTIKTTKAQEKITQGQKQLSQALAVKK